MDDKSKIVDEIVSPGIKNNPNEVIASVHHVSKRYKGCLALNDVSLDIHRGDLVGLVGKNGAGKNHADQSFNRRRRTHKRGFYPLWFERSKD
jgi:ABC-type polysaccharide/polyol phosphate transport system ATPase subunit